MPQQCHILHSQNVWETKYEEFEKYWKKTILFQTRILVTHAITFLPQVDRIVVLNDGHVTEMGQYDELLQNNGAFADFLRMYLIEEEFDEESSAPGRF